MAPRLKPLRVHILIRRSREARRLPSRFSGRPEFRDPPPPPVYRHDAAPSSGPRVSQVLELARALSNSSDRPHMFTASTEYAYLAPPLVNDHQIAIPVPGHGHDPVEQERVRSFDDTDAQRRLSGQARVGRVTRGAGDDPHPGRIGDCGILTPHFQRPAQGQNRQRRTNQSNRPHLIGLLCCGFTPYSPTLTPRAVSMVARRATRMPVAYITPQQEKAPRAARSARPVKWSS